MILVLALRFALLFALGWFITPGLFAVRAWMRHRDAVWTVLALNAEADERQYKREMRRNRL